MLIPRRLVLLLFALIVLVGAPVTKAGGTPPAPSIGQWTLSAHALTAGQSRSLVPLPGALASASPSRQHEFVSAALAAEFEFIALGATWLGDAEPSLEVRVSDDGQVWGPWIPLPVEPDHGPDGTPTNGSELLFVRGRFAQLRVIVTASGGVEPASVDGLALTYLDTRAGPSADQAASLSTQRAAGEPTIIPRANWGANESYRFDSSGSEIWEREYRPVQKFFVHHTATTNYIPDPAAAVRAVYAFHALPTSQGGRGWGDIGYNFVLDQQGRVYEGRFGGERDGGLVVGGHVKGYNSGSMGVSTLGNFDEVSYPATAEDSLTSLLAARAGRYGVDPLGSGSFVDKWFPHNILGHRDAGTTSCPGQYLYNRLPAIRQTTANKLASMPQSWISIPILPNPLLAQQTFSVSASDDIVAVDVYVNAVYQGTDPTRPFYMILTPAGLPAGQHTVRVEGRNGGTPGSNVVATAERTFNTVAATNTPMPSPTATFPPPPTNTPTPTPPSATATPRSTRTPNPNVRPALWLPVVLRVQGEVSRPTPTPAVCEELFVNGDMEGSSGWVARPNTTAPVYTGERFYNGSRSLRLGLPIGSVRLGESWSSTHQEVSVPAGTTRATLELWLKPEGGSARDGQFVELRDPTTGVPVARLLALAEDGDWRPLRYVLPPHLTGQPLQVYLGVRDDGLGETARLYVDEASFQACR